MMRTNKEIISDARAKQRFVQSCHGEQPPPISALQLFELRERTGRSIHPIAVTTSSPPLGPAVWTFSPIEQYDRWRFDFPFMRIKFIAHVMLIGTSTVDPQCVYGNY